MSLQQQLRGTGVALVTPFKNGEIDWDSLGRLIEHVIGGGVEFLVSLGTTGEANTISEEEHRQIIDFTIKTNNGRVPLVVGVFGGNNTAALVRKVQNFNFDGIDALLASSPAYNKPSQEGIFQHYMALVEASPRPIIIYNVPSRTASNLEAETTLRLAHANKKFIAIKEAANDVYQSMTILKGRPDGFLLLSGDDFITLPLIGCGGDGVISVIANTLPEPFTDMVRAALKGDLPHAQKQNFKLLELYRLLFAEGNPSGVKASLELQGICGKEVRLPLVPMSDAGQAAIKQVLDRI